MSTPPGAAPLTDRQASSWRSALQKAAALWRRTDKPFMAEWIVILVLVGILFFSHLYWDIVITTRHGINVWDSLFGGRFFNFYYDNVSPAISGFSTSAAIYPFPMYMIFAIWDFPLWIMETVFKKDPFLSTTALMYAKCILIPFLFGCFRLVLAIARELGVSAGRAKWCGFWFLSSNLVLFSLVVTGQYDIFSTFFVLLGVYAYLRGKVSFVAWFAVAISLKLLALFIFIPLLLLREKRVLRLLLLIFCGMSVYLCASLFPIPPASAGIAWNMIGYLFQARLPLTYLPVPIFVAVTVVFWVVCYMRNPGTGLFSPPDADGKWHVILAAFVGMGILFVCCYTHLYWIILMSPFLCLLSFRETKHARLGLLLETALSAAVIFALDIIGTPVFAHNTIQQAFPGMLFGPPVAGRYSHFGAYLSDKLDGNAMMEVLAPACTAIFVGGIIMFAYLQYREGRSPRAAPDSSPAAPDSSPAAPDASPAAPPPDALPAEAPVDRGLAWCRLAINLFVCGLPLLCYFVL